MRWRFLIVAILCVIPAPAGAVVTGTTLYQWCSSSSDNELFACGAYMQGFLDGRAGDRRSPLCIPADYLTLDAMFMTWAREHPETLRLPAGETLTGMISEKLSCPHGSN
jgi:hypothetical protein